MLSHMNQIMKRRNSNLDKTCSYIFQYWGKEVQSPQKIYITKGNFESNMIKKYYRQDIMKKKEWF